MSPKVARRAFLPLLMVAAAACSCMRRGAANAPATAAGEVRVEVASVGLDRDSGAHFVLLEDEGSDRGLPIQSRSDAKPWRLSDSPQEANFIEVPLVVIP